MAIIKALRFFYYILVLPFILLGRYVYVYWWCFADAAAKKKAPERAVHKGTEGNESAAFEKLAVVSIEQELKKHVEDGMMAEEEKGAEDKKKAENKRTNFDQENGNPKNLSGATLEQIYPVICPPSLHLLPLQVPTYLKAPTQSMPPPVKKLLGQEFGDKKKSKKVNPTKKQGKALPKGYTHQLPEASDGKISREPIHGKMRPYPNVDELPKLLEAINKKTSEEPIHDVTGEYGLDYTLELPDKILMSPILMSQLFLTIELRAVKRVVTQSQIT